MGFNTNLQFAIVSLTSLFLSTHAFIGVPSPSPIPSIEINFLNTGSDAIQQVFKSNPEILDFCRGTENPTLCAKTIAPQIQDTFNPLKALEIEMEATLDQSMKVANIIEEALENPNTDVRALDALRICKSQYKSIKETVTKAVILLEQQNVVDAYYKFSSIISDQSACEDAFLESPGVTIFFADESLGVFDLGGNCLAIMDGMINNPIHVFLF